MTLKSQNIKIEIDHSSKTPVYDQIKQEIKLLIASGELKEDTKMPSIRELAGELKINHNTIVKVYYQLDMEGFLYAQKGKGYFVKKNKDDQNIEKDKILEGLTKEYIEKVSKLGFETCEIIDIISKIKN